METHGFKIIDDLAVMGSDFFEDTPPVPSHLCNNKEKNFPCEHPFLRKLCYNSFDDLPLYAVIPVLVVTFLPTLYR